MLHNSLDYVEHWLTLFQGTKVLLTAHHNGIGPEISQVFVQYIFSKIEFMQHSYGQYKAGFGSAGLDKYKSYPASPAVMQHSYGQYKAGFGSAGLDKYKSYPASPAVMQHSYGQYKAGFGSAGLDKYKSYPASPAVM